MNKEFLIDLQQKTGIPKEAFDTALMLIETEPKAVESIFLNSSLENIKPFTAAIKRDRQMGAMLSLSATLLQCEKTYELYHEKGIPDDVFYDTMSDIAVWVKTAEREEGIVGLLEMSWLRHSLYMNLFKIGRLQYQFYKTDYLLSGFSLLQMRHAPIKNKTDVLNIHIPEGGKLSLSDCQQSVLQAREFFSRFYPEYKYSGFVCDSWLLDSHNRQFMSENSNIVLFSNLFDSVFKTRSRNNEIVRRLWGKETGNINEIKNFSEETTLQKQTKQYLLSGGKTGNGYGFIL